MSEDPDERPVPRRPARPARTPERPASRRARAAAAQRSVEPPEGSQKRGVQLPRWFWLLLVAEMTFVLIVAVDAITGWGDTPEGCFSSVCSLGQGVGIISLFAAILLGIVVAASFLSIAVGAAQGTRRAARDERERSRQAGG